MCDSKGVNLLESMILSSGGRKKESNHRMSNPQLTKEFQYTDVFMLNGIYYYISVDPIKVEYLYQYNIIVSADEL